MHIYNVKRGLITASSEKPQAISQLAPNPNLDLVFTKGFISIPDEDDEIVIVDLQDSEDQQAILGIIEPVKYNLEKGDRLIITNGAQILLKANGTVRIGGVTSIGLITNKVDLGAVGGQPVARVGDTVEITIGLDTYIGTITSGSPTVNAN